LPEVAVSSRGEVPPADEPTIEPTFTADLKAPVIQSEAEPSQESSLNLASREVFLSLYNESSDRVIEGKVQVVDTERSRLITLLNGNEYTTLPDPKNNSRQLTLICEASGYRKVQQEVNYDNPLTEESQNFLEEIGTTLVVNFPLVRYQKGDIYALYSVYFYNDAAIFLPESKFELNELLVMLQENPKTRIRLHGHSNGNSFGKIISVGPSGDRFSLAKDTKVSKGSSKELSAKRAELIKSFLIDNGIHPDRIETKAWGGKRPLHDKNSANAKKNVRVEVEILETK
jgi:outer membrane protein OmpA-like peptidoglycan-associated protein